MANPAAGDARQSRSAHTRERILSAARELFVERGYDGTTIRQIAARSGLTDPAIHYHFSNKQHIFEAVLSPLVLNLRPEEGDPYDAAIDALVTQLTAWANQPDTLHLLIAQSIEGIEFAYDTTMARMGELRTEIQSLVSGLYADSAMTRADALVAIIVGIVCDGVLSYGQDFGQYAQTTAAQDRFRRLFAAALPHQDEPDHGGVRASER